MIDAHKNVAKPNEEKIQKKASEDKNHKNQNNPMVRKYKKPRK